MRRSRTDIRGTERMAERAEAAGMAAEGAVTVEAEAVKITSGRR